MAKFIIDVSEHQGSIDWEAVKPHIDGAIIRCGYGNDDASQDDKQWARNVSECERLGIPFGVYLYSYATDPGMARSEAQHALRLIAGRKLQYPVYFDSEQPGTEGVARACAEAFGDVIEAAGYWCGVYASRSWFQSYINLDRFTKWIASWGSSDAGMGCDMWQYSSDGSIAGISGRVDCNWCYRDFPAEIGGGSPQAPAGGGKSVEQLAQEVIQGLHGNGDERKASLGSMYDAVQARVNELLGVSGGSSPSGTTYVVQSGDTLSGIGARFGVDYGAIASANGIADPDLIYAGQVLTIPDGSGSASGSSTYIVQAGDCLSVIGDKLGIDWTAIAANNGIGAPYTIYPGQVLYV
ncbi:MAG TPA: LysM peptidoglycan-binding domain-containing protein [Candidatus Aphodovivens avistercoris]|nr:LysM peptidoglycan-binding domain-containing protein [Candidatus Aphodovivens avistercoris]